MSRFGFCLQQNYNATPRLFSRVNYATLSYRRFIGLREECTERGYDAGKCIKGRKRHILVDSMGLLLFAMVLTADIQDRDGAKLLFAKV